VLRVCARERERERDTPTLVKYIYMCERMEAGEVPNIGLNETGSKGSCIAT